MSNNHERERRFAQKIANIFLCDYKVKVAQGSLNVAYCDVPKKRIYFDFPLVFEGFDQMKEMMNFKGYAFHEILHLKYTSRISRADKMRLNNRAFDGLIQRLEDGRIETLGVMRYQKLADFLIHAVNSHILSDREKILKNTNDELINAFILLYGRSIYFPDKELIAKIRELLLKTYGQVLVDRLEKDIDDYILENVPTKRFIIAKDLYDYLCSEGIYPKFRRGMRSDIFQVGKELKNLPKALKELQSQFPQLKKRKEEIRKEIEAKTPEVDQEKVKKEKAEKEAKAKVEKEELRKQYEDLDKEWDKLDDEWDNADSEEKRQKIRDEQNELEKEMEKTNDRQNELDNSNDDRITMDDTDELDIMIESKKSENEDLEEDNKDELNRDLKSVGHITQAVYSDDTFTVDGDMVRNSKKLSRGINKLNTELKQGYVDKEKSGRLNIRRYINRKNVADVKIFKKWLPDQIKKTKMLINLFIDGSGSMDGSRWETTLGALWIINEAFNKDDNKVMAYQFSRHFAKIKGYEDKLTRPTFMGDYTYIEGALGDALPQIEKYRKANGFRNVVNIIITDGAFQDNPKKVQVHTKEMDRLKHHTILINVDHRPSEWDIDIGVKSKIYVKDFDELTPKLIQIFSKIKKSLIRKVM